MIKLLLILFAVFILSAILANKYKLGKLVFALMCVVLAGLITYGIAVGITNTWNDIFGK